MGTHAIIAVPTSTGFKGRFVHYDGFVETMMPAIKRCIRDHKVAGNTFSDAVFYMLGNHWTSFNISEHTPSEAHSHDQVWYTEQDDIDAQYVYILDNNEVTAYANLHGMWIALDLAKTIMDTVNV